MVMKRFRSTEKKKWGPLLNQPRFKYPRFLNNKRFHSAPVFSSEYCHQKMASMHSQCRNPTRAKGKALRGGTNKVLRKKLMPLISKLTADPRTQRLRGTPNGHQRAAEDFNCFDSIGGSSDTTVGLGENDNLPSVVTVEDGGDVEVGRTFAESVSNAQENQDEVASVVSLEDENEGGTGYVGMATVVNTPLDRDNDGLEQQKTMEQEQRSEPERNSGMEKDNGWQPGDTQDKMGSSNVQVAEVERGVPTVRDLPCSSFLWDPLRPLNSLSLLADIVVKEKSENAQRAEASGKRHDEHSFRVRKSVDVITVSDDEDRTTDRHRQRLNSGSDGEEVRFLGRFSRSMQVLDDDVQVIEKGSEEIQVVEVEGGVPGLRGLACSSEVWNSVQPLNAPSVAEVEGGVPAVRDLPCSSGAWNPLRPLKPPLATTVPIIARDGFSALNGLSAARFPVVPSNFPLPLAPSYFVKMFPPGSQRRYRPPWTRIDCSNIPKCFTDALSKATAIEHQRLIRRWETVQHFTPREKHIYFRVVSYNVLCQETIPKTLYLYKHLTGEREVELSWETRKALLEAELPLTGADVLCLQEVQEDHYESFYLPFLKSVGYSGVFKKRTRDFVDGCAVFHKNRLQLVSHRDVEYFVDERCVLDRDNVALIVRLRDKRTGLEFCVANTHLLFNMKRGDVKLAQLAVLLANLDQECGSSSSRPCPLVICGDFNLHPFSILYNFLVESFLSFTDLRSDLVAKNEIPKFNSFFGFPQNSQKLLNADFLMSAINIGKDCKFLRQGEKIRRLGPLWDQLWTHPFSLASVYTHFADDGTSEVSSFNSFESASAPDFMFYSIQRKHFKEAQRRGPEIGRLNVFENRLRLIRRLTLPNLRILSETLGPWPNRFTPSDHIPIMADFVLLE